MNKRMHVIYVTGLGDSNPKGQRLAVKLWRLYGVRAELFQMNWADGEAWPVKFARLLKRIDELAEHQTLALVGASAGAGATINAFAARKDKLVGCVLIAGKVNNPNSIGDGYRRQNPAFVDSATAAPAALKTLSRADRQRILSLYGLADEIVTRSDSYIPGAHNHTVLSAGHFFNILTQITIGAPRLIRFLKHQAKN